MGNLPFSFTEDDVKQLFEGHGSVTNVKIVIDRETNRSRGFGFVTMEDEAEVNAAVEALSGKEVNGRSLVVNVARPREENGGRSGGFGGGGFRGGSGGGGRRPGGSDRGGRSGGFGGGSQYGDRRSSGGSSDRNRGGSSYDRNNKYNKGFGSYGDDDNSGGY